MAAPAFYKIDTAGAMGPRLRGCVKTRASRECAELFSPFSSFGDDWQSSSFPIHRNRERISTRKFEVGVFTQPGLLADQLTAGRQYRLGIAFGWIGATTAFGYRSIDP